MVEVRPCLNFDLGRYGWVGTCHVRRGVGGSYEIRSAYFFFFRFTTAALEPFW